MWAGVVVGSFKGWYRYSEQKRQTAGSKVAVGSMCNEASNKKGNETGFHHAMYKHYTAMSCIHALRITGALQEVNSRGCGDTHQISGRKNNIKKKNKQTVFVKVLCNVRRCLLANIVGRSVFEGCFLESKITK